MAGTGNGIVDRNGYYRDWLHVRRPGLEQYGSAAEIPDEATYAGLARSKTSHRGIREKTKLRELVAGAANQDYLEQIASLEDLEYLELAWPVTASDLAPIASLHNLRTLKIDTPRAIADFCAKHDLEVIGEVPWDEDFATAEQQGRSPYDHAPGSAGIRAIRDIADRIAALAVPPAAPGSGDGAAARA